MSIQLSKNGKMVIIPVVTQTPEVVKKPLSEKIFDVVRTVVGEMPSGPLAVELLQYEQNSMLREATSYCHIIRPS